MAKYRQPDQFTQFQVVVFPATKMQPECVRVYALDTLGQLWSRMLETEGIEATHWRMLESEND